MQFSKVIVALAAVASVQAANNSSESSSVSTAGAAVNTYESPHLEPSHITVESQSSSEPLTAAIPPSTQLAPTSLKKTLPHLAKPIAVPTQPRYRVGLSKRARVDPLHPYLKKSQPPQPS
ncbi:hypothetical protein OGATHE_004060 [Ogataea polymorpha]|uniref:Uncharacterized protein n=1 Tax=Ogataea polymorpha TaxID=460523 RepID=A0A9P8P562_9ASCO|nr:hypothetical protein OGATHE_004060 [Ogataea polymorpha]